MQTKFARYVTCLYIVYLICEGGISAEKITKKECKPPLFTIKLYFLTLETNIKEHNKPIAN